MSDDINTAQDNRSWIKWDTPYRKTKQYKKGCKPEFIKIGENSQPIQVDGWTGKRSAIGKIFEHFYDSNKCFMENVDTLEWLGNEDKIPKMIVNSAGREVNRVKIIEDKLFAYPTSTSWTIEKDMLKIFRECEIKDVYYQLRNSENNSEVTNEIQPNFENIYLVNPYPYGPTKQSEAESMINETKNWHYGGRTRPMAESIKIGDVLIMVAKQNTVRCIGIATSEHKFYKNLNTHGVDVNWFTPFGNGFKYNGVGNQQIIRSVGKNSNSDVNGNDIIKEACNKITGLAEFLQLKQEKSNPSGNTQIENAKKKRNRLLNQILYGPPGTGKTYSIKIEVNKIRALDIYNNQSVAPIKDLQKKETKNGIECADYTLVFTTFHPAYGYEEFIEGIRPVIQKENATSGQISYDYHDGIFKELCDLAKKEDNQNKPYFMIIDEINRGNIPKIFGELITLIEDNKRAGNDEEISVTLPYSGNSFTVPNNVHIIGTMNTADKSLTALDTALRRRFTFIEMMPDYKLLNKNIKGINVRKLLKNINKNVEKQGFERSHHIGHAFFMACKDEQDVNDALAYKVIPLLQEYTFDDWEKMSKILFDNEETIKDLLKRHKDSESPAFKIIAGEIIKITQQKTETE